MRTRIETRETDRFRVTRPASRSVRVIEFTQYSIARSLSGNTERIAGQRSYQLDGGGAVSKKSETEFVVVADGTRLMRAADEVKP